MSKERNQGDIAPPPLFRWVRVAVYWHSSIWDTIPVNRLENEDLQQYRRELTRIQARFPEWDLTDYSCDPPVPPLPSVPARGAGKLIPAEASTAFGHSAIAG